jgi:heme iron utilization protein
MSWYEAMLIEIVGTQYFAVLNTVGQGLPHSSLVSFASTDDMRSLVFVTGRNTRKYRNMEENSNVSLLIDNRTNKPSDTSQAIAITAVGTCREATDNNSLLQAVFLARHPQLRHFAEAPGNAIMRVIIREYIVAAFDKTKIVPISW